MKRLLLLLTLLLALCVPARATPAQISGLQVTGWQFGGATANLRLYSSGFHASDGTVVPAGSTSAGPYQSVTCTVASNVVTCPTFTVQTTTNALDDQTATYTGVLFDSAGRQRVVVFSGYSVPVSIPSPMTYTQLAAHNLAVTPVRDTSTYTKTQTDLAIAAAIGSKAPVNAPYVTGAADATLTAEEVLTAGSGITVTRGSGTVTVAATAAASASTFNVKSYGATGDGTTDDTAAINAAIAALNTAGRGILYFPAGDYRTNACAFTNITANGMALGDGHTDSNSPSIGTYVSRVKCMSATAVLFTVNSARFKFKDLVINNSAATTPTAGAGIKVTNASNAYHQVDYEYIAVERFYDLLDIEVANNWSAYGCWFRAPVRYGAHIRNLIVPDTGGWAFIKSSFVSNTFAGIGIFAESCGGAHIIATNILGMAQAVKVTGTTTGILGIVDCNFENLSGIPVELSGWHSVRIVGTEFGMWDAFAAGIEAIKLTSLKNAEIVGNVFNAPFGGDRAITLHNCEGVNVARQHPGGYSRLTAITGTWEPYTSANDGFLALGFVNGWANVGAGFQPAEVSLEGGWVVVRLNVFGGTLNSQITTLPLGYRPKMTRMFTASDNGGHCRIIVGTDGTVSQYQGTSNAHLSAEFAFLP